MAVSLVQSAANLGCRGGIVPSARPFLSLISFAFFCAARISFWPSVLTKEKGLGKEVLVN